MESSKEETKVNLEGCVYKETNITTPFDPEAKEMVVSCQVFLPERIRGASKPLILFSHKDISHKIQINLSYDNSITLKIGKFKEQKSEGTLRKLSKFLKPIFSFKPFKKITKKLLSSRITSMF